MGFICKHSIWKVGLPLKGGVDKSRSKKMPYKIYKYTCFDNYLASDTATRLADTLKDAVSLCSSEYS